MQGLQTELEIRIDPQISVMEVRILWKLYNKAFERIAKHNPCRQHFHKDEFESALANPDYHLIIGYDGETPIFFCMLTTKFEIIPWIAPEFFDTQYPETVGRRIYIPVIFINVVMQGQHHFSTMMKTIQKFMEERGLYYAFYDHGSEGPTSFLTSMITATPRTKGRTVGTQVYDVVQTFPEE